MPKATIVTSAAAAAATTVSSIVIEAGDVATITDGVEVVATATSSARDLAIDPEFYVKVHPEVRGSCPGDQTIVDCRRALSSLERRLRLRGDPVFRAFLPDTEPRCEGFRFRRPTRMGTGGSPLTV